MNRTTNPVRSAVLGLAVFSLLALFVLVPSPSSAGPYVTETSGIRWNDVGGIRWNDVGGIRWNDVGGIRWNDVGGIRWNDVGGLVFIDSQGIRWNDVGGIRWNDVGGLEFVVTAGSANVTVDLELLPAISFLPDTSTINVIVSYEALPDQADLDALVALGVPGGKRFRRLPMLAVNATRTQVEAIAGLPRVRSIWADKTTSLFDDLSGAQIGLPETVSDADLRDAAGQPYTGAGVTIAVLDTGVDATHPDLLYGSKVVENVRLTGGVPTGPGFSYAPFVEGLSDTDVVMGHGTFVASVAAGSGDASGGLYAGVAPGASILALSAGDFFIVDVLEGFDYILDQAARFNVRVVNCSWGTQGWFDPDDPINIATRELYDAGINVVFASGNHGPAPDTLNPYSVAPWVVGVGSVDRDGRLSDFSSRGIHEELLYHPTLVAPGRQIIAARAGAVPTVEGIVGVADPTGGESVPAPHQSSYTLSSGTSFAAPHVAGTIALMLEADPTLTPDEIKRRLQQTATPEARYERASVGAGRVDAWAALAATVDPDRPFGKHVAGWTDQRSFALEHLDPVRSAHTLPAAGTLVVPVTIDPEALTADIAIAWGDAVNGIDLDFEVRDAAGQVLATADAINGQGLFGRTEGVHLTGDLPQALDVVVTFKDGVGPADADFDLQVQSTVGSLPAFGDLGALDAADRRTILLAVTRRLIDGRGGEFRPMAYLTRGELARSLALAGGMPQRLPGRRSFGDVGPSDDHYPYIETAAGDRAIGAVMDARGGSRFQGRHAVRRIDLAQSLVRAAGLESVAQSRAGEALGLGDDAAIPARLRGYAALALERGFIESTSADNVEVFQPSGKVTRLDTSRYLLAMAAFATGEPPVSATARDDEHAPQQRVRGGGQARAKRTSLQR